MERNGRHNSFSVHSSSITICFGRFFGVTGCLPGYFISGILLLLPHSSLTLSLPSPHSSQFHSSSPSPPSHLPPPYFSNSPTLSIRHWTLFVPFPLLPPPKPPSLPPARHLVYLRPWGPPQHFSNGPTLSVTLIIVCTCSWTVWSAHSIMYWRPLPTRSRTVPGRTNT